MEKDIKSSQMALFIQDPMLEENLKDMEHSLGKMEKLIKVNG